MYDFSGIYSWIASDILIFGGACVFFLWKSKCWIKDCFNKEKNDIKDVKGRKRDLIIAVAFGAFLIYALTDNIVAVKNPDIKAYEGAFIKKYHERYEFGYEYVFSDNGEDNEFTLDKHSEQKLIPGGFIEGEEYRIYYEDRTDIIVRVEKID